MTIRKLVGFLFLALAFCNLSADEKKSHIYEKELKAIDDSIAKAVKYLMGNAQDNGSIGNADMPNPGVTGLIIAAIAKTKHKDENQEKLHKAAEFILQTKNPENNSYGTNYIKLSNYFTSVAIMAYSNLDEKKYATEIQKTRDYLKGTQFSESNGDFKKESWQYGGFDYNDKGEAEPDLNNTGFALAALHQSGLDKNDETWKRAQKFLERVHNSQEVSDLEKVVAGTKVLNDGGAMYYPGNTKGAEITNTDGSKSFPSYGSMTYQLMQSYLFAGVPKDDKRVQETMRYIKNNWTLESNPGLPEAQAKEGLFNYYRIMADALNTLGDKKIETGDGKLVVWAKDLSEHLIKIQESNGSWMNKEGRWMEGDPNLVTAYTILALSSCRENLFSAK